MHEFPKSSRLLKRRDFERVSRTGSRKAGRWLFLEVSPSSKSHLGITVTRKYGKAHERNRFKRLVREAFRHAQFPKPLDLIVRPRGKSLLLKMEDILFDLQNLISSK